jgi:hypothetical protein
VSGALADGDTAMAFDGEIGYLGSFNVTLGQQVTVEAWLRTTRVGYGAVFSTRHQPPSAGDLQLGLDVAGRLTLFGATTTVASQQVMTDGAWHHVVATADGATQQAALYVDGAPIATSLDPFIHAAMGASAPSRIGGDPYTAPWEGRLDEVAIYPTALTPAQIAAHYTLGTASTFTRTTNDLNTGLSNFLHGTGDLTTRITAYLATLTGDYTARWKQMERDAGF